MVHSNFIPFKLLSIKYIFFIGLPVTCTINRHIEKSQISLRKNIKEEFRYLLNNTVNFLGEGKNSANCNIFFNERNYSKYIVFYIQIFFFEKQPKYAVQIMSGLEINIFKEKTQKFSEELFFF